MYVCRGSRKLLNLQSYYIDDSWARLSQQVLLASLSSSKDLYGAAFSAEARRDAARRRRRPLKGVVVTDVAPPDAPRCAAGVGDEIFSTRRGRSSLLP